MDKDFQLSLTLFDMKILHATAIDASSLIGEKRTSGCRAQACNQQPGRRAGSQPLACAGSWLGPRIDKIQPLLPPTLHSAGNQQVRTPELLSNISEAFGGGRYAWNPAPIFLFTWAIVQPLRRRSLHYTEPGRCRSPSGTPPRSTRTGLRFFLGC